MRSVFLVLLAIALAPATASAAQPTAENSTAKRISGHIQESGRLRNYRIGVTYENGVATLSGTVTSPQQREAAIRLAKEVPGVNRVECQLEFVAPKESEWADNDGAQRSASPARQTATPTGFQSERSGVVHAIGEQPRVRMQSRNRANQLPRPMRRGGNMPMPAARTTMDRSVRQASAENCCPPGGGSYDGYSDMGAMGGGGPGMMMGGGMGPMPSGGGPNSYGASPNYENPSMPGYAWPSYASYPNYAALSYPQQYSPTAWPYIGPFYPYPQVPLAWRKVSLEWDDGWWFLDFSAHNSSH